MRSIQVVSREVGWCDVEFEPGEENAKMYEIACMGALLRAAGEIDVMEGKGVKRVAVRELTEDERVAYEVRFGFVWQPGKRGGSIERDYEGT